MDTTKLFQPIKIGNMTLKHRVVMSPMTRFRASTTNVPSSLAAEFYTQRGSTEGTLLISEAAIIAPKAGGYPNVPGIWNDEQIVEWKKIVDAVHAKGSFIFLQVGSLGRQADPALLKVVDPASVYMAPSAIPVTSRAIPTENKTDPREMTIQEIEEHLRLFATAASNAVNKAGFDGVEIHGANGYLVDQFCQDVSNTRTDAYGGSIENRSRFAIEVVDAVAAAIGAEKTAIKFSPWNSGSDMGMKDPVSQFSHIIRHIRDKHPHLAYIHMVEPRLDTDQNLELNAIWSVLFSEGRANDFARKAASPIPIVTAGYGFSAEAGVQAAEEKGDLIAYARAFISNPDLPLRIKNKVPIARGDRSTYYVFGSTDPRGYTDYPFA